MAYDRRNMDKGLGFRWWRLLLKVRLGYIMAFSKQNSFDEAFSPWLSGAGKPFSET
jgi:hypothetical protein